MSTGKDRVFYKLPDQVSGYELDPAKGYLSVVIPEATTNIVLNPSIGGGSLTGYTAYGAGVVRAATYAWQAYGEYGLQITPAASVESGVYYGTISLTSGNTYTASVTIQGEAGKIYYIWFATTGAALLGNKSMWIGTGMKQRIYVTYTETSSTTRRVYVSRDSRYTDVHPFYIDGLQVEAKAYPTTYCDGDQNGYVPNEIAYYWTGTPHASASGRLSSARSGGREYSLLDLGFHIDEIEGLGMSPLVDQSIPIPGYGEFFQGTGSAAREFTLNGGIYANSDNPRLLHQLRKGLIDAFKPWTTKNDQPLLLRYQALDADGFPVSEMLDIVCTYLDGLEGDWNNHQQERLSIRFKMHTPFIQSTYDSGGVLTANSSFACTRLAYRSNTGVWDHVGTGLNNDPKCSVVGRDGLLYIGGRFTTAGGVAVGYICSYDPNTSTFAALGAGCAVDVNDMKLAPNGDLYVCTASTGGVAKVRKWSAGAWTDIGGNFNSGVSSICFDMNGRLYAVGTFTTCGGVAMRGVCYFEPGGAAWTEVAGASASADVKVCIVGPNNHLYVAGTFDDVNGVSGTKSIAEWDTANWLSLDGGVVAAGTHDVTGMLIAPNGELLATGQWDTIGGVAAKSVAAWNGFSWRQVSDGITFRSNSNKFYMDFLNNIYHYGDFLTTGAGVSVPDGIVRISGNLMYGMDVNTDGTFISIVATMPDGSFYIGGSFANAVTSYISATNIGGMYAYPTFVFTGPGNLWQVWNIDTDSLLQFHNLTLLAGEVATLVLAPDKIEFSSNFRANLQPYILKGSSLGFHLKEGANNISVYMSDTTAASLVVAYWKSMYWSLDGAVVEL